MNADEAALRERVKELRTLYRASRLLTSRDNSPLADRLQQVVDIIPAGWLYPDITEARLVLEDRTIATAAFRETPWLMSAAIDGPADAQCRLDVVVLEERPARDEGPFLREERELLDTLAASIGDAVRYDRLAQLHAQTIASIEEAVITVDARGAGRMIADVNPAAERMFGYDRTELVGRTTELLHVDAAAFERFGVESRTALEEAGVFHASYPLRRKDGTVFYAEQTVTLLVPDQGLAGGAVSVIRDVSERRRVEARRRESDERFRQIAEHIEHVLWMRAPGSRTMDYVSPAYERVWGRPADELYEDASNRLKYLLPSDRQRLERLMADDDTGEWEHEYRIIRPDGAVRWIVDRSFAVRNDAGDVERIIGVAEDITESKQLEQKFGVLSQEITDVIYVIGTDGTVLLSSPSVEAALGYSNADFDGSNAFDIVHPADRARVRASFAEVVPHPGAIKRTEYRVIARTGAVRHVETVVRNLIDHPAVGGVLVTARDVTERIALDERIRQAQKLEAVGRLAGGIAHDFNNLMTVIRAQTELLLLDLPSGPLTPEIEVIQAAADKAAGLTAQLLAFSRDQVLQPQHVDIGAVVHGMTPIIKGAVGETITVEYDLPAGVPAVELDPGQLELAVLNLAVNARDAMPAGGTLRIAARADDAAALGEDVSPVTGRCVVLEIQDSGGGMTEDVRSHVFEPFFTTKPPGKGTGLGLAMVYGFVKQSGGSIGVDSTPGAGATFRLVFAATSAERAATTASSQPASTPALGQATMLLVEDDPNVRRVTTRILERDGFQVTAVADAEAGLELLHGGQSYDLILTDLGLPGMSGRDFAQHVRHADAGAHIVLMSGYDVESAGQRAELTRDVTFLQKPFTRLELLAVIRAKLGAAAPSA